MEMSEGEKDIGVLVDRNLSFSKHITQKVNKANSIMELIRRIHSLVVCHSLPVGLWILSYSQTHFDFCHSKNLLPILLFALIAHNFSVFLTSFCVGLYQELS
jgi:hypothetical protein